MSHRHTNAGADTPGLTLVTLGGVALYALRDKGSTEQVLGAAERNRDETIADPVLTPELIGRETEFATLLRAWQAARGGAPRHVHVAGAAGLGKTRLLADAVARLRASGVRTISVRAHHTERQIEFAVASDLAASLAALPGSAAISAATAAVRASLY